MTQTVLILGANGKFGRHACDAFHAAGWQVRRFDRARDDLTTSAQGADVIVMAGHPPSYATWAQDLLAMHARTIAAARAAGASVLLPGSVYNFAPDAPLPWGPDTTQGAQNPLGQLRIRMEQMYRDAGVPTIVLRCGDFIDTRASGNWFDRFIAPRAPLGSIRYPGPLDRPHAWAYLPDAARAAVALAQRRADLGTFADIPFPGFTLSGAEMAAALEQALGRPIRAMRMAWWPLHLLRPVMPLLKGVFEMRYLWSLPHRLDARPLHQWLPDWHDTPLPEALRTATAGFATPASHPRKAAKVFRGQKT